MRRRQVWPDLLLLVRHGESAGNVARDRAEAGGLELIDIAERDMDVALSPRGREQAEAVGRWLAGRPASEHPSVVLSSPYVRARTTAELVVEHAGLAEATEVVCDERLREREFGVLDRLTKLGIKTRYPEQAEFRAHLGKFYHRPPGGESWCDVALRVRSAVESIGRDFAGERVMVVSHQVVLLMFRYVLERLSEHDILAVDRAEELANCSVGAYEWVADSGLDLMSRRAWNSVVPVEAEGAPVTAAPDVPAGPK